ncbi:fatty acid desaturase family protein [Actinomycetospora chibensis]|uniref:Fatty acid desaturase family protein n=1 Tax=Actinomycetospora chibensis TaxID=663606 RepID=A0ABV9RER9_9PSEU|nr:acyl-CoA desaturase [Actinomycetospora chibensis]MDD7927308.1 acyl-CoA desaturase [Actinomycetospora chibensis]
MPARRTEFAELTRTLRGAGLLDRRLGFYAVVIAATAAVFVAAVIAFVLIGDSWWAVALAPVFAVVFTHCGFIGHDAGHRQIFTSTRANDALGYLAGNLAIGLGYSNWVLKHNAHHANPNHDERDPDVQIPVIAFSPDQAVGRRGPAGFITRHQAALFFPLLLLEAWSMHVTSVAAVVRRTVDAPRLEAVLLLAHATLYLGTVFWVLSPGPAVVFVVVQQGLFGLYLGASFAPNHKGMPMVSAADQLDPIRKQVLTSRNIRGSTLVDHGLGALNYQIEHHLFPRMPRPNLRRAQPLVAAFCARQDIAYTQTGFLDSYAQTLRHLHTASAPLRAARVAMTASA